MQYAESGAGSIAEPVSGRRAEGLGMVFRVLHGFGIQQRFYEALFGGVRDFSVSGVAVVATLFNLNAAKLWKKILQTMPPERGRLVKSVISE